jgi:Phosphotransferase enzyme family
MRIKRTVGRSVTIVVCDRAGNLRGSLGPFEVDTAWWQEVEPIRRRFPTLTVVRLLHGTPGDRGALGGEVTYLAEGGQGLALSPAAGLAAGLAGPAALADHPLRMPWARPGGPAEDLDWAANAAAAAGLQIVDQPMQHRTWNLSCIWSMPVRGSSGNRGRLWLKCVPGFFAHEAAVLRRLSGQAVPELVAAEGHRLLLAELPGRDAGNATMEEAKQIIECLVALQIRSVPLVPALLADGVPEARGDAFIQELRAVVARRAPADPVLRRLADEAGTRLAQAQACGLPDVLVHGDAHPGNARIGAAAPVVFDWGDSRIGNPVLDLAVLSRLPGPAGQALAGHWLRTWKQALPGSEPERAWQLLRPLAALRFAVVYQHFLDNIEPSERVYHEQDVQPALEEAACLVSRAPGRAGWSPL